MMRAMIYRIPEPVMKRTRRESSSGRRMRRAIREAISQLPAGIREVLVLREMEGMSYKEIATVTGMPIGTVMSRLARAARVARLLSGDSKSVVEEEKG